MKFLKNNKKAFILFFLITILLAILSPFASNNPDGLEKVAIEKGFDKKEVKSASIFGDYAIPPVKNDFLSKGLSGILGTFSVFGITFLLFKINSRKKKNKEVV